MHREGTTGEGRGAILVVEDDADLRRALSRILRHEGHDVVEVSSGFQAMEVARASKPSLVVVDAMMPGMDGEMVIRALQMEMRGEAPPALLLTTSEQQQDRATRIGAAQGLFKPFRVEDLLRAVDQHRRKSLGDA